MRTLHRVLGVVSLTALLFTLGCPVYVQQPVQPVGPGPVPAATVSVIINNISAEPIHYIYMSPSAQTTWGPDLLGASTILEVGATFTLTGITSGTWDIKVVDSTGNCKVLMNQTLTEGTYTLDVTSDEWQPPANC